MRQCLETCIIDNWMLVVWVQTLLRHFALNNHCTGFLPSI